MQHYKDIDGEIYGYKATDTCVEISYDELDSLLAPSETQIEETRVLAIKNECSTIIFSKYSQTKQTNAALGLESEEFTESMKKFIANMKQQCKDLISDPSKTYQDFILPVEEK